MPSHKLSASALSTFLRSPKAYYWRYHKNLEPLQPSVLTFDHDKLFGILWAEFVDNFYKGAPETANRQNALVRWHDQTEGWVPEKAKDRLTKALEALMPQYYQMFRPDDGTRNGSELWLEDDMFVGRLDGLSPDKVVHEVKSTSRSPQLSEQLWRVQNSIQVKLYCVMANAIGHCVEFAFKDPPYQIFRGPVVQVNEAQKQQWNNEHRRLGEAIRSLGDECENYPCHPDGCIIISKNFVGTCPFQALCEQGLNETTSIGFKTRERK